MSEQFTVIEKAIGPVIEIEENVPVWKMPATFGRDFKKIANYIVSNNAEVVDMPYGYYKDMDWEREINRSKLSMLFSMFTKKWHLIVGMVSSKELPGSGELKSQIKATKKFVRAVHLGPYQESAKTYKALMEWANSQGISVKNEVYEFYANDPAKVPKDQIKTVIYIPIVS